MSDAVDSVPQFAAALSTREDAASAVAEVCQQLTAQLSRKPHLVIWFASQHHAGQLATIASQCCDRLGTDAVLGCTAESIVGGSQEIENAAALSMWGAVLPDSKVLPMHLELERSTEGGAIVGWPAGLEPQWPQDASLVLLGEPYSFPADALLERLNEDRPGVPVVGGMASGGDGPGENRLAIGREVHSSGAVAVLLSGGVRVQTVVSQGCRPIGRHFVITKSERNVIYELGGKPALLQLKELFDSLPNREQQLVQHGLHVGRVVNEYQSQFQHGDFLVRNVIGIDPDQGSIAIGDYVRPGQTVQFHVRDAETADEDLRMLLQQSAPGPGQGHVPSGALLFTCNGRGTRLFGTPHHDVQALQSIWSGVPVAGFFAQGEFGPVAGQNFVHGFTASVAIFSARPQTA